MKISISSNLPTNIAVASARSCYSSKLVTPEKTAEWDRKESLMKDLFKSGHHTTMQHTVFTFEIEGVSRLLIWRLLHSHQFYNSDQVSQRYAKVKPGEESYYFPKSVSVEKSAELFEYLYQTYLELTEILTEIYEKDNNPVVVKNAKKKAMEMARYVLPQATKAHLYHSVNFITALRYIKAADIIPEARDEAKEFADMIEKAILSIDPSYKEIIEMAKQQKAEFPNIDMSVFPEISDGKLVRVFDLNDGYGIPNGINYANGLNMNALFHPAESLGGFTSRMRLSFSADAQEQRHRTTKAIREPIKNILERIHSQMDFIAQNYVPPIISKSNKATALYGKALEKIYKFVSENKISKTDIPYFLPNSFMIEIVERNDIVNYAHKAKLRTCLNAQEEIRYLTEETIEELKKLGASFTDILVPPCVLRDREGIRPICPEGPRFCGIKLWKNEKYKK